ncbi:hypothetical protein E2562_003197 [Oryza meyeriana var. granulata]|uniref:Uncharacterized protein n=1 Tax=Oryza meyeriana var. granulata TaxID=110450 RepID=A0A6G1EUS2_9ORYZ|nr:hypothetical protein E2562_003197 [Oryza meyeriana var. granulata]
MDDHPPRLPASVVASATPWTKLLAPFDLSRLCATLASRPLTLRRLGRLLALLLSPSTSLLTWYTSSDPARSSLMRLT